MRSYISKKNINNFTLLCLLPLLLLFLGRCAFADNNVYRDLIDRDIATYEDGCRALSCFVDVHAEKMVFDEVVAELEEKGIIEKSWKYKAEKQLTRGIVAYMSCKILKIKGGLTMRVMGLAKRFTRLISKKSKKKDIPVLPDIGMGKRYAFLEFQHMGLVPHGYKSTYITGHDMLAWLYRLEQYIKVQDGTKKQAEEKGKEKPGLVTEK